MCYLQLHLLHFRTNVNFPCVTRFYKNYEKVKENESVYVVGSFFWFCSTLKIVGYRLFQNVYLLVY